MHLEPVFLVAPRPPAAEPSRRAFLAVSLSFVAGGALGTACGYSIGTAVKPADASAAVDPPKDDELKSSGDVELDELRWLAVKAPIEKLVERHPYFLFKLNRTYRSDEVLWRGVGRLCAEVGDNPKLAGRSFLAKQLIIAIQEIAPKAVAESLSQFLPALRAATK